MALTKISFLTKSSGKSAIEKLRIIDPAYFGKLPIQQLDPSGVDKLESSDVVLFQREYPYESDFYSSLLAHCKEKSIPTVYDIDDYLHGLPITHPDRVSGVMSQKLLSMYLAIHDSNLVTVSTDNLKKQYEHLNSNIRVLPNYFDDRLFSLTPPQIKSHDDFQIRMLYVGGKTHLPDVEMIAPVLKNLLEEFRDRLTLHLMGIDVPRQLQAVVNVTSDPVIRHDYEDFAAHLQIQNADIVIAPLGDNLFNQCKSPIKFFEYCSLGTPGVFSKIKPYIDVVNHGYSGFLASTLIEWEEYLRLLIMNPRLRYDIANQAQDSVRANHLLSKNSWRWEEVYEEAKKMPFVKKTSSLIPQLREVDTQIRESFRCIEHKASLVNQKLLEMEVEQATLKTQIMDVQTERNLLSEEINTIKRSKAWRMAMFLRNARVKLLPNESIIFKSLRRIYQWINRPRNKAASINLFRTYRPKRNQPLISVIIPIYDRTDLLRQSIDSILHQTYRNIEILLVCDGSPEETLAIVEDYARNYPDKIRVFKFKLNSGNAVKGRNKGIVEAQGEFVAFQDSDDVAEPKRLEFSLETMKKYEVDIVYGAWRAMIDGSRKIDIENGDVFTSPDCDLEMLKKICVPCQSTVMAKTEALRSVGGLNTKMGYREDHELWLRLANAGYKFKADTRVLTNLRLHEGNLEVSLQADDKKWEELLLKEYQKPRKLRPKIGYVLPGTGISGGIGIVVEHANRLIERGYDVSLITEDDSLEIGWFPKVLPEIIPLNACPDNYDLLVATGWSTAYSVGKIPSKRKLYFVQSDETRFFPVGDPTAEAIRKTYMMEYEMVTIATWLQEFLWKQFGKESYLVRNGINPSITYHTDPLVPKTKKLRVLLEGPIDIPFKGMKDAFAAVQDLDCEVWCVSSAGKPKPEWKCDRFFFKVPLEEMKKIYSSCDVLLKMSRVEGCPLPPLEMMTCGGTAVIGQVTGIEEYARDGYNCLIVNKGDIEGAKNALQRLIEDRELLSMLKTNGSKTAQDWSWDPSIDVLEKVINK